MNVIDCPHIQDRSDVDEPPPSLPVPVHCRGFRSTTDVNGRMGSTAMDLTQPNGFRWTGVHRHGFDATERIPVG
uniref:Uncharacterized protein n=1 Tax=Panagrellus redivivus TaxID=6233 RepID=A0A7E4ZVE7_PANRE